MVELVAKKILITIKKQPRTTAQEIAEITGFTLQYVHNTLRVLRELDLVDNVVRGVYVITEMGTTVLTKIIEPEEEKSG